MHATPPASGVISELATQGDRAFPEAPRQLHHIGDVRFYLAKGIFVAALALFIAEFLMTAIKTPANGSLDTLRDTFAAFDTLNAGVFTALGAIIGFYFAKARD